MAVTESGLEGKSDPPLNHNYFLGFRQRAIHSTNSNREPLEMYIYNIVHHPGKGNKHHEYSHTMIMLILKLLVLYTLYYTACTHMYMRSKQHSYAYRGPSLPFAAKEFMKESIRHTGPSHMHNYDYMYL